MPRQRKPNHFLSDIKTAVGNALLDSLIGDGWCLSAEYDVNAIDKGIDHDFFELKNDQMVVLLEWDNWDEWSINVSDTGAELLIAAKLKEIEQR